MTNEQRWITMGYIKGVFGVKGWIKVSANTEYPDSLLNYKNWRLCKDTQCISAVLEDGKLNNDDLLVKFDGYDNREQAFSLRGFTIEIPRSEFEQTNEDEFYWADLVGMQVVNSKNVVFGKVINLMETGAHDILVIKGDLGQTLIPFVSQYIIHIDEEENTINVDWDEDY